MKLDERLTILEENEKKVMKYSHVGSPENEKITILGNEKVRLDIYQFYFLE